MTFTAYINIGLKITVMQHASTRCLADNLGIHVVCTADFLVKIK